MPLAILYLSSSITVTKFHTSISSTVQAKSEHICYNYILLERESRSGINFNGLRIETIRYGCIRNIFPQARLDSVVYILARNTEGGSDVTESLWARSGAGTK